MTLAFDPARHDALLDSLRLATAAMEGELNGLASAVNELRQGWDGAAQAAYESAQLDWGRTMTSLHRLLREADEAADVAGLTLRQAEISVTAIWA